MEALVQTGMLQNFYFPAEIFTLPYGPQCFDAGASTLFLLSAVIFFRK